MEQLGLGQYAEAFVENAIEWTHLSGLDHETLQAVGVKAVGHRMTILMAVASLSVEQSVAFPRDSMAAESHESLAALERHPGERKPVTMLFADITGSTALTEKLDAEEAHDLLYGATQRMCAAVENNRPFLLSSDRDFKTRSSPGMRLSKLPGIRPNTLSIT